MVKQIELHYSPQRHVMHEDIARTHPKAPAQDDFVSEALQRFKAGKISEAALREILGSD